MGTFINVIHALFFRELKTRFGVNRYLGYLWVVGEPAAVILIVTVIGTIIREYRHMIMPEDIPIFMFLITGIMPFFMFRSVVNQLMNGIGANLALFSYKPVKPIHVFVARTLLEFCIYFVIFVSILLGAGLIFKMHVLPYHFLNVAFCVVLILLYGFALGMCFSIIAHFFPTLRTLLGYYSIFFYWSSGIIIPVWLMPNFLLNIFYWSPLFHIMEFFKLNFFATYPLTVECSYFYVIFCIMSTLFAGLFFYYYKRGDLTAATKT